MMAGGNGTPNHYWRAGGWIGSNGVLLASAVAVLLGGSPRASADLTSDYQSLITGTSGLQNYWNFEDLGASGALTTVADVQGGKNGSVVGTVDSVAGLVGFAGSFPGGSDNNLFDTLIEIVGSDTDTSFDLSGTSFTIEALVKTNTLPAENWSGIISKGDSAWRIARNRGDDFIQGASNGLASDSNSFHDLDNDIWHYTAIRYDNVANTFTTIFDDAPVISSVDPAATIDTNNVTVMIGGNSEKPEREWQGLIDEVAIYTTALTDAQIQQRLDILDADPGAIDESNIAYWTGDQPTGSFASDAGWDNNAPQPADTVVIGKGGEVTSSGNNEVANLEVGSTTDLLTKDSNGTGTLNVTGGELLVTGGQDMTVGKGTVGEVVQTGGKIVFKGNDYELGEDANGDGKHTLSNDAVLEIGSWYAVPDASDSDTVATAGFYMDNGSGGDDISIGRERTGDPAETAVGELIIEDDAVVRVANDAFIPDVGEGFVTMRDNAVMHIGDDARAGSADNGEGAIDMSGNSRMIVEARFSIADSTNSKVDVTMNDNASVDIGRYLAVGGKDNLGESGEGTLTLNGSAKVDVGAILYRGDFGDADDIGVDPTDTTQTIAEQIGAIRRIADDHQLYVGAGPDGEGSGTVNQNGATSVMTVGREANIGFTSTGEYYLRGGLLEVRGDAPIDSDFSGIPENADGNGNGLQGFVDRGGDLIIGREASGNGLLSVEGGDLEVKRDLTVGLNGTGRLRVKGGDSTINVGGDFGIGWDFGGAAGQDGTLEAVLTGSTHSVINVNGGTEGIPGDVLLFDAELEVGLGEGYRPAAGDYSGSPLEWQLIDFAGSRDGAFALAAGLDDGTLNGAEWSVRYDDANGDIFLQALTVYLPGDLDLDGDVDSDDFNTLAFNFDSSGDWSAGDFDGNGVVNSDDFNALAFNFGSSG